MRQTQNTQKKNNRRSILVIALLLMLVAVIGFGGYTLSKYVTKKEASANASVAKWGFTATADAGNLFGTNYKFVDTNSVVTPDTTKLTVKSSDDNKKVAPGTTGSMTFSIKGSAEVLAQVKIEMTETHDVVLNYKKGETTSIYNPVLWTLTKKTGATTTTLVNGDTLNRVAEELKKVNNEYAPNSTALDDEYTLSWAWTFHTSDEDDILDTLLAMYANDNQNTTNRDYSVVENGTTNTTVSFKLSISIEQLQKPADNA